MRFGRQRWAIPFLNVIKFQSRCLALTSIPSRPPWVPFSQSLSHRIRGKADADHFRACFTEPDYRASYHQGAPNHLSLTEVIFRAAD